MVRKRYIRGQLMKSPARLGEMAPSTSTPSTGVETRSAGEAAGSGERGAAAGIVMARLTLGEAYDTVRAARTAAAPLWAGLARVGVCPSPPIQLPPSDGALRRRALPGTFRIGSIAGHRRAHHRLVVHRRAADLRRRSPRASSRSSPGWASGSTSPASSSPSCSTSRCCCTRRRTPSSPSASATASHSITLHFLGGMTEIDGHVAQAAPRVLDRRRGAADLDRGRRGRGRRSGSWCPTASCGWRSGDWPAPTS